MTMRRSTTHASRCAILALMLGGCAAVAPPVEPWKAAPVGASWQSQQRNTGSYGKDMQAVVTRVADIDWKGTPAVALRLANGATLLQQPADGRWLAILAPDGKPMTSFEPAAGWSQPIAVGDTWKRPQKATNHVTDRTLEYEWSCKVAAIEKVTVPAGTFDALRVECAGTNDSQDTFWVAAKVHPFLKTKAVRGPKHVQGPGTQETELLTLPG